ncbi:MAG: carbamoyl-phosphate synthase large subunit [Candidatus Acidulodesulfobacterium ferriphilum]|uniref:Carbamoyl phosphate synthase large chain n=1 Tax=Candidatus Acidulodesulfobacterium ferriphilum TaxID=2597223 RepID=A0A519B947_9DELT|nr:MAG: carbamoyl-phosphate synthase large subunit [Candidatus Acidulodesulfobacterium ferriphilum]
MPKRTDIKRILIVGSGPIVIGQAAEFDYSGTQGAKALAEEGYEVILVNSNPATIMTDPGYASKTYIEPLTKEFIAKIIEKERPDSILPTLGGQTALNLTLELHESGVLQKYGLKILGANVDAIKKAEDREYFKKSMEKIGVPVLQGGFATNMDEAYEVQKSIGFPVIIRPSFTLGGTGGGIAYNIEEFAEFASNGINASPINEILIEKSVIGFKEVELEVMTDKNRNTIIICSIENFDPMGIHTGDSITVAPVQTLNDKDLQKLRDYSIKIMNEIGVETGGSNIQFALDPDSDKVYVIEMNPRVSRSSSLASKATGFAIAKIAAKLAVGYTLDEITNDITKKTLACFEPSIDYVVTKIPRFTFEKFPQTDNTLTTHMKSVGEVMAIGRTFAGSIQKAARSLENGNYGIESLYGLDLSYGDIENKQDTLMIKEEIRSLIKNNDYRRLFLIADALRINLTIDEINELSKIDKWFLNQIKLIIELEKKLFSTTDLEGNIPLLREAKEFDFSNWVIAKLTARYKDGKHIAPEDYSKKDESAVALIKEAERFIADICKKNNILRVYKKVDTCAAEFEAATPYMYSSYDKFNEVKPLENKKIVILGSGPNRIGQGIEFDYCCVHCALALKESGYSSIMVNCNPETVSTDYDTSSRLYFEPLTSEDVMSIENIEANPPIILQFGGQTPLKLAKGFDSSGIKILGTSFKDIDTAEDREKFKRVIEKLNLLQPNSSMAFNDEEVYKNSTRIGFPVLLRPSYVLGGRAMEIIYNENNLRQYIKKIFKQDISFPILIDKFLEDAIEVDVDALSDSKSVYIAGIMEHIEEAGVHSGDSACSLPAFSLDRDIIERIKEITVTICFEFKVMGLINIQYAVKNNDIYVIEVNPRASRTVPFVSKATGIPVAKLATKILLGEELDSFKLGKSFNIDYYCVKEAVFPFSKFSNVDPMLGPEMRSTGEVMGIDVNFGMAYAKSQIAAGQNLPLSGAVLISVKDEDKKYLSDICKPLIDMGFHILATKGTSEYLSGLNIENQKINKVKEGRPHIIDALKNKEISMIFNTPRGMKSLEDSYIIRRSAIEFSLPYYTTIRGAAAACMAIRALKEHNVSVRALQDYYKGI